MRLPASIVLAATFLLLPTLSQADTGLADRVNEARSFPGTNVESRFVDNRSHSKTIVLMQRAHEANLANNAKLKDRLHEQFHEELELHTVD